MGRVRRAIPHRNVMPNVLKVLELIVKSIRPKKRRRYKDAFSRSVSQEGSDGTAVKTIRGKCVDLIVEALRSHRYEEAAKLLWIICHDRTIFDPFLYKAVMLVVENLIPNDESTTMWKLFSDMQCFKHVNKKEVQLDYIIYGLKNNLDDLQRTSQDLISRKKKQYLRKNSVLDPIFEAYCSLLDYLEWEKSSSGEILASQGKSAADKAIDIFKDIIAKPGQWDIFVLKLVEMLEFYDRHDEIEPVLMNYRDQNPNHLNSYIYLCVYLSKNNPDSENLIDNLETLADLYPFDERVLLLVEKWKMIGEKNFACLKYLFMFLDYPCNGENVGAWKMLLELLMQCICGEDSDAMMDDALFLWNERSDSWYWIHFNPSHLNVRSENDRLLLEYKVKVISILDSSHIYIKKVVEKVPDMGPKLTESTEREWTANV